MGDRFIQRQVLLYAWIMFFVLVSCLLSGCADSDVVKQSPPIPASDILKPMNYCIQVGAFLNLDNAIGLMDKLMAKGMDAYYFKHSSGLYKVRFGNYQSESAAREIAAQLQAKGIIEAYLIIKPEDYAAAQVAIQGKDYLRVQLIKTAENFVGMPYRWGGTSAKEGFDCSGLTMTVYRLNGLALERTSERQYQTGKPVSKEQLQVGDLVFFTTNNNKKVSHVGIYIGENKFIHATTSGKKVKVDPLSQEYYIKRYLGARTYI